MTPSAMAKAIASIHFAELDSTYWPFGLDLRELQASRIAFR